MDRPALGEEPMQCGSVGFVWYPTQAPRKLRPGPRPRIAVAHEHTHACRTTDAAAIAVRSDAATEHVD
jgi:hypothetical protein